jgi:choline-glycine betaine transporter
LTDPERTLSGVVRDKAKAAATRLYAWWVQWWWTDLVVATALVVILRQTAHPATGSDALGQLTLADRRAIYADTLQLTAVFAGFSGVAFTIYLGLGSRKVSRVKVSAGVPLLRVWLAALITPWICAVIMICCAVTDRGDKASGNITRWVAIAALLVVILQMIRIVWIFYQLAITDLEASKQVPSIGKEEVRVVKPVQRSS